VDKKQNKSQQSSIDDFVTDSNVNHYIVYTDGSCIPNPGSGGWAYEIRNSNDEIVDSLSGSDKNTTNNRMELTAVIKSIQSDFINNDSVVTIKSDSQLIINTMIKNWKKKENIDLWENLEESKKMKNLRCKWEWVKAHAGIEGNENVDQKANQEARMSHLSKDGNVNMVDVSDKNQTIRVAKATSKIKLSKTAFEMTKSNDSKKGNVLATAKIAGIQAAKKTHELIPLCHQINLTNINIDFILDDSGFIIVDSEVKCIGNTGVEMEALTSVTVASLTIYDMLKSVDKRIVINDIHLISKSGGKSGDFNY
jgi:molybdenum cofactor biosynthesis protein MoaC